MKRNPLLDELRLAFPPKPISAAGAFDQRGRFYCDVDAYSREMEGKTWEQLDPQFFARRSDGLDFLGDEHLAAVLPLYLHLLVVFKPTSPVPETLLPLLTPPEPTEDSNLFDWKKRRFDVTVRSTILPSKSDFSDRRRLHGTPRSVVRARGARRPKRVA